METNFKGSISYDNLINFFSRKYRASSKKESRVQKNIDTLSKIIDDKMATSEMKYGEFLEFEKNLKYAKGRIKEVKVKTQTYYDLRDNFMDMFISKEALHENFIY